MEIGGKVDTDAFSTHLLPNGRELNKSFLEKKPNLLCPAGKTHLPTLMEMLSQIMKCQTSSPTARITVLFFDCLFVCLFVFLNFRRNSLMLSPMQMFCHAFRTLRSGCHTSSSSVLAVPLCKTFIENRISQCVAKHCLEKILRLEMVVRAGHSVKRLFRSYHTQCVQCRGLAHEHVLPQVCVARMVLATKQKTATVLVRTNI